VKYGTCSFFLSSRDCQASKHLVLRRKKTKNLHFENLAENCFKPDFEIFEKDKMIFLSKIGLLAYTCLVDFYQKKLVE
jgi:hypothetical protein